MIIGMESEKKGRAITDLNQDLNPDSNPDSNTDPNTDQDCEADFPERFEECEEPIGTKLSDILRRAVNAAGSTNTKGGTDTASRKSSSRSPSTRKKKMFSENVIEREFVKAVHLAGGIAYKFALPEVHGMPDRLVLMPGGRMAFVEVKAPGRKPRPLQESRHSMLRRLGFRVYVLDSREQIGGILDEIQSS